MSMTIPNTTIAQTIIMAMTITIHHPGPHPPPPQPYIIRAASTIVP